MTYLHSSIRGLENASGANQMRLLYTVQIARIPCQIQLLTLPKTGLTKSCLLLRALHHFLQAPLQPLPFQQPLKHPLANRLFMRIGSYQARLHQLLEPLRKDTLWPTSPVTTVTLP